METPPLISVIIPAFNRASYIGEALASVFNQDYPNTEVLVVDDGSSDGTYEILKEHHDLGAIKLLTHPGRANRGQSAALNLGLREAKGDLVAILDSDDMFAQGKLQHQARFLKSNPDVGMVYGQGHAVDASGAFLFEVPANGHTETGDPNFLLLDCYMALPGGALIRKSVLEKVGFFEEAFRAGQDHDMALRIMEATKTVYLPELAFYYRKHGDSISAKGLERRWKTGMEILDRARLRYPYRSSTIRKRKAVLHFRLGQTYWRDGCKAKALPHLFVSGALDPVRALSVVFGRERV
ncbi:glycosyltransferase [Marinobacter sp. BW6]|uniref:glycosyltransferase family 2 protein n=1 Tax=Marinobacter sp. BW6 TaxID=2592624 RepID=UPI0011DE9E21|nr:glycosyltransferase [Marinobacter sp. BW6]TYC62723.1 glycosyltransferase [Marinobacter sp. BW6]